MLFKLHVNSCLGTISNSRILQTKWLSLFLLLPARAINITGINFEVLRAKTFRISNPKEMKKSTLSPRDLMFLDHDETRGMSVSYDFSNSWANRNLFVYDCGTHYSNCHLVIFHNNTDSFRS